MEHETQTNGDVGITAWLVSGLEIEEEQIILARLGKQIANQNSLESKIDLAKRRQKLHLQINKFNTQARTYVGEKAVNYLAGVNSSRSNITLNADKNDIEYVLVNGVLTPVPEVIPKRSASDPECEDLPLPIRLRQFDKKYTTVPNHTALANKEYSLREGQANDALRRIREDLSHLAWQFKKQVRLAKTTKQVTRSWAGVHILNRHWRDLRLIYLHARQQMIDLKGVLGINASYRELTLADCKISTIVPEPNARSQRDKGLSWLWTASVVNIGDNIDPAEDNDEYILECE